jgi:hypothetical protein
VFAKSDAIGMALLLGQAGVRASFPDQRRSALSHYPII